MLRVPRACLSRVRIYSKLCLLNSMRSFIAVPNDVAVTKTKVAAVHIFQSRYILFFEMVELE